MRQGKASAKCKFAIKVGAEGLRSTDNANPASRVKWLLYRNEMRPIVLAPILGCCSFDKTAVWLFLH